MPWGNMYIQSQCSCAHSLGLRITKDLMLQTVTSLPNRQCPAQGLFFLNWSLQQSLRQFGASVGAQSQYLHEPHHKSHHIYICIYMYICTYIFYEIPLPEHGSSWFSFCSCWSWFPGPGCCCWSWFQGHCCSSCCWWVLFYKVVSLLVLVSRTRLLLLVLVSRTGCGCCCWSLFAGHGC